MIDGAGLYGAPGNDDETRAVPAVPSPTAYGPLDPDRMQGHSTAATAEESAKIRYARHAISPIPWMVATAIVAGAAYWAYGWSEVAPGATDPVRSSEWWANVNLVLLPGNDPRIASYSTFRMWVAIALLVATAGMIAVWIGRMGRNIRPGHMPFGSLLPLVALPAWWVLPITLGDTAPGSRSRDDLIVRYLLAIGLIVVQYLLLRWPLLNRIWRAGRLRYDMASVLLWLPMMIPWGMILLSTTYALMVTSDGQSTANAAWRPTPTMVDWAQNLTHVTQVAVLILLIVVTISQHVGIQKDKAEEAERRVQQDPEVALPTLGV